MTNKQGRPSSWTEEEVAELIRKRSEGVSITECAQCLGRTPGAVSGKLWQLRDQGRIKEEDAAEPDSEERGELNPLEQGLAEIIEEQKGEIEKLTAQVAEQKTEIDRLKKESDGLLVKGIELHNRAKDLEAEFRDTQKALAETGRQFDEYRKETENAGADAILARYEKELERAEAEISRLTRALERANRVALGVVEKFALGEAG